MGKGLSLFATGACRGVYAKPCRWDLPSLTHKPPSPVAFFQESRLCSATNTFCFTRQGTNYLSSVSWLISLARASSAPSSTWCQFFWPKPVETAHTDSFFLRPLVIFTIRTSHDLETSYRLERWSGQGCLTFSRLLSAGKFAVSNRGLWQTR